MPFHTSVEWLPTEEYVNQERYKLWITQKEQFFMKHGQMQKLDSMLLNASSYYYNPTCDMIYEFDNLECIIKSPTQFVENHLRNINDMQKSKIDD